jgi:hypothetical protein
MIEQLKEIYEKGRPGKLINKKYENLYDYLLANTQFLDNQCINKNYQIKITQRLYHLICNINEIPKCLCCDNLVEFLNKTYRIYCSNKCKTAGEDYKKRSEKGRQTKKKKYGNEKYNNSEKNKQTNLERYGVDCTWKSKKIRNKGKQTKKEKYGDENYSNWKKGKQTCLEKYGVESNLWIKEIRDNIIKNNLKKYGVEHHTQSSNYQQPFNNKKYHLPSGKIITIQGYENLALDLLLKTYNEEDLVIGKSNIFKQLGKLEYTYNNKTHRYFPDIYIKSENLIIEVKSSWTYKKKNEINLLKRKICLDKHYNFSFWVFDKNKSINIF